jgi:hypothetical protein
VNHALNKSGSSSASRSSSETSGTTGTSGQSSASSAKHGHCGAHANRVYLTRDQIDQIKQDVAQLRQQIGSGNR